MDIIDKDLKVMDLTAATLCKDTGTKIYVFALAEEGNLMKVINGENVGNMTAEEVEEEIGLKTSPSDYTLYYSGQTNDVFFDDYYMKLDVDLSTLVLDELEVDEVCWMTPEEIYAATASGDYLAEDVEEFDRLLEWKKAQESLS